LRKQIDEAMRGDHLSMTDAFCGYFTFNLIRLNLHATLTLCGICIETLTDKQQLQQQKQERPQNQQQKH